MAVRKGCLRALARRIRESLLLKLLFSVTAVITLAVLIYGIVYLSGSEKRATESALEDAGHELDSVFEQISKNQYTLMVALRLLTTNDELMDMAEHFESASGYALYAYKYGGMRELVTLSEINSALRIFRLYSPQSVHVELWPVIYAWSRVDGMLPEELLQPGADGWQIGHADYAGAADSRLYISYFQWVREAGGCTAEVGMPMDDFFGEYYSVSVKNTIAVTAGNGAMVCAHGATHAGLLAERGAELADLIWKSGEPAGSLELNGQQGDILLYRYSDLLQQYVCNIVSRDDLRAFISAERVNVVMLMALVLLLLHAVISLIIFAFLKRLTVLKDYMLKVQNEGMDIQAVDLGNDEVGQLARVFNNTVGAVQRLYYIFMEDEENLRRSELRQLQQQINWHFAYNTLGAIEMHAVVNENYHLADAISAFGKLLRYAVEADDRLVTLEEEIAYLRNYVLLINMQFDDEVTLEVVVPDTLRAVRLPRLLLQPLVENAFQHGFQEAGRGGVVKISACEDGDVITIAVEDNGAGIAPGRLEQIEGSLAAGKGGEGFAEGNIALVNIQRRVRAHFGQAFGLALESDGANFTKVSVRLPMYPTLAIITR